MLTAAWIFMGIAISASIVLLGDLKREKEYNNRAYTETVSGGNHGSQKKADRYDREVLYRCG